MEMIVLSPEISGFEKKAPQLSHLEHFEILGRRLTDLIGSFTKNPDTLRTKFSRL